MEKCLLLSPAESALLLLDKAIVLTIKAAAEVFQRVTRTDLAVIVDTHLNFHNYIFIMQFPQLGRISKVQFFMLILKNWFMLLFPGDWTLRLSAVFWFVCQFLPGWLKGKLYILILIQNAEASLLINSFRRSE